MYTKLPFFFLFWFSQHMLGFSKEFYQEAKEKLKGKQSIYKKKKKGEHQKHSYYDSTVTLAGQACRCVGPDPFLPSSSPLSLGRFTVFFYLEVEFIQRICHLLGFVHIRTDHCFFLNIIPKGEFTKNQKGLGITQSLDDQMTRKTCRGDQKEREFGENQKR